jgi:putative DNA primase/helicase
MEVLNRKAAPLENTALDNSTNEKNIAAPADNTQPGYCSGFGQYHSKNHETLTLDAAWSMLSFIDAHDRENWLKIGMALKSEFSDSAFSLFDNWSQTAENYKAADARSVWRSFHGSGVSIGTLVYMAKKAGWNSRESATLPTPKARRAPSPQKSNTAGYAAELWLAANKWMQDDNWLSSPSPDVSVTAHPYAIAKGIESAGGAGRGIASGKLIGKQSDCLIVPIRDIETNKLQGVQCINTDGIKQSFGGVSGGALILGNTLDKSLIWYVCEGWASALSVVFNLQNGNGVCACAFGKSNLDKTAKLIGKIHQPDEIIILREDDS